MQHADTRFVQQMISNRFAGLFIPKIEISQTEIEAIRLFHFSIMIFFYMEKLINEFRYPQIVE